MAGSNSSGEVESVLVSFLVEVFFRSLRVSKPQVLTSGKTSTTFLQKLESITPRLLYIP